MGEKGEAGEEREAPAHAKAEILKKIQTPEFPTLTPPRPTPEVRTARGQVQVHRRPSSSSTGCSRFASRQGACLPSWSELMAAAVSLATKHRTPGWARGRSYPDLEKTKAD